MTFRPPQYMQNSDLFSYSAADDRFVIDTLFSEGILNVGAGQGLATQRPDGANMTVSVPPFDAIVKGDDAALQGSYLLRMTVAESATVTAAPGANSRIDLLVCEVVDSTYRTISTANPEGPRLRVIAGTAAATPTVPTLPATAIPLAQITVAAGQSSIVTANITDLRTQAGAATLKVGTQVAPVTQAQRDAITTPFDGQAVYNVTTAALEAADATSKAFAATTRAPAFFYGRGGDGDVTITGTVTLSRAMEYRNLTVAAGAVLNTAGFLVQVSGILRNLGTIAADGGDGGDGTAIANVTIFPAAGGTSPGGFVGQAGGLTSFNSGDGSSSSTQGSGPLAGTNASGSAAGRGGSQNGAGAQAVNPYTAPTLLLPMHSIFGGSGRIITTDGVIRILLGGQGGGGGTHLTSPAPSGSYTVRSGGGGGGGGTLTLVAAAVVNDGTISAKGGKGGAGVSTSLGATTVTSAPGGGGGGGVILILTRHYVNRGTVSAPGGAAGTSNGGTVTAAAAAGSTGNVFALTV